MSTTSTASHRVDVLHPALAAAAGALIYGAAMIAGDGFGLNSDSSDAPATTAGEIALYAVIVVAAGVIATWLGLRARAGSPQRLAGTALGLAIASAATFVIFWSGWPQVFGAVAIVLALEYRRRVGSFSASTVIALVLGAIALVAAAYTSVVG